MTESGKEANTELETGRQVTHVFKYVHIDKDMIGHIGCSLTESEEETDTREKDREKEREREGE